jgi:hypothetical protein
VEVARKIKTRSQTRKEATACLDEESICSIACDPENFVRSSSATSPNEAQTESPYLELVCNLVRTESNPRVLVLGSFVASLDAYVVFYHLLLFSSARLDGPMSHPDGQHSFSKPTLITFPSRFRTLRAINICL